jgi:hypothetical protein
MGKAGAFCPLFREERRGTVNLVGNVVRIGKNRREAPPGAGSAFRAQAAYPGIASMSLLGKILAVFNFLAVLGFIYFAATDYGKRQQWEYAVFLYDIALDGLPVDENQKDVDGNPIFKNLNKATLTDMFQSVGGQAVSTQLAEVNNVKSALVQKIDSPDAMAVPNPWTNQPLTLDAPEKKRAWYMLPFARSLSDRDLRVTQMIQADPKLDAAAFEQLFTDALARNDAGDKRNAIADLLFGLIEPGEGDLYQSQGYKRFVTVVGRRAAATAIDNQASALASLSRETEEVLAAGRSTFAEIHGRMTTHASDLFDALQRDKAALELQRNQTARQQELVNESDRHVKDLQGQLSAARKKTRDDLNKQEKLEKALLDADRKLRDANDKNQGLEKTIRKLEERP